MSQSINEDADLLAGADGCCVQADLARAVPLAVRRLVAGGFYLGPCAERGLVALAHHSLARERLATLTAQQERIPTLLFQGNPKDIAMALNLANQTVHVHVRDIYKKPGVHTRAQALRSFLGLRI